MVDAGIDTEIEVLVDNLTGDVATRIVADPGVVHALGSGISILGEAERAAVLVEKIFLLEAEPSAGIIEDGRAGVGGVGREIGVENFTQDDGAVALGGVRIDRDRFQHAVGAVTLGLTGGAAVESPVGYVVELGEFVVILDQCFAAQVGDGLVTVEPNIFQ